MLAAVLSRRRSARLAPPAAAHAGPPGGPADPACIASALQIYCTAPGRQHSALRDALERGTAGRFQAAGRVENVQTGRAYRPQALGQPGRCAWSAAERRRLPGGLLLPTGLKWI